VTEADTSLRGWKAIADYLDVSVRTAQAYHRRLQLPIKDSATSSVCANPIDLER